MEYLTSARPWATFRFILYSLVLGLVCYLIYWIGWEFFSWIGLSSSPNLVFLHALQDGGSSGAQATALSLKEIAIVTILAAPVAFAVAFTTDHKLVHRLAQRANVTTKFAEVDVWDYIFNAMDGPWVMVRDTARESCL